MKSSLALYVASTRPAELVRCRTLIMTAALLGMLLLSTAAPAQACIPELFPKVNSVFNDPKCFASPATLQKCHET